MARTTKQLSGGGKDKFLRAIIAGETAIPADAAKRVGDALCAGIAEVRVRREAWDRGRSHGDASAPSASAPADVPTPAAAPFDPFAFSAIAVLAKQGKAGLLAKLSAIEPIEDLKSLAQAQHLALDPAAENSVATLREAIVAATEARLAERRASAS